MNITSSPHPEGTLVNISPEELQLHMENYIQQHADIKLIKDNIFKLLQIIGLLKDDGTMRESMDMKKLMDIAMKAATGSKKLQEEFGFLVELFPVIVKYKDL